MADEIIYIKNFMHEEELQKLKSYLESLQFKEHYIKIFKKQIKIPRLQLFLGEPNISYTYSNQIITTMPWHYQIINLKNKIEKTAKESYNCVLVNKYRNGEDYVSFHQDTEKELINKNIPSFSIGETRKFILKNNLNKITYNLESNDLLIIPKSINETHQHSIPKEKNKGIRYNLTFRYIKPSI
ncbi:MAG: alpha-ketoglutarate-dependent dioxygenase AlkB [Nanoarchaeota archaeon]